MLERDSGVEPGDLVQMRFAQPGGFDPDTLPGHNQVTALVAKHDSRPALFFGHDEAALSPDKLTAADPLP
jgi:hypothetical protein